MAGEESCSSQSPEAHTAFHPTVHRPSKLLHGKVLLAILTHSSSLLQQMVALALCYFYHMDIYIILEIDYYGIHSLVVQWHKTTHAV